MDSKELRVQAKAEKISIYARRKWCAWRRERSAASSAFSTTALWPTTRPPASTAKLPTGKGKGIRIMRTLSEPQASEKATEARSQSEETAARIEEVLQQFEVLSSKAEQRIVSYVYLFISGAALFFTVLYIVVGILWCYSSSLILTVSSASLLIAIGVSLIFWAFNAWRRQTPHILRDVFVKRRIQMSAGDTAREYLGFLEHYGAVLKSPRRYLLIGGLEIITVSFLLIYSREYIKSYYSTVDLVHSIVSLIWLLLMTLMDLGIAYYLGILLWALLISGWHIRELSRRFEFRIEPVCPWSSSFQDRTGDRARRPRMRASWRSSARPWDTG